MKKWHALTLIPFVLLGCTSQKTPVTSFEECIAQGNTVMESHPRQCRTSEGQSFVEDIGNELEKMDLIRLAKPRPGERVEKSIVIEGEARGYWFFEATFPFEVTDSEGKVLAQHYAEAQDEWMTTDFVPFSGAISLDPPEDPKGWLILRKSNASGLPEHDDELRVPIRFR